MRKQGRITWLLVRFAAYSFAGLFFAVSSSVWWAFSGEPKGIARSISNAWHIETHDNAKPNATVLSNRFALARSLNREANGMRPVNADTELDFPDLPNPSPPVFHAKEQFGVIGRSTGLFEHRPFDGYQTNTEALVDEDAILEYAYGWPRLALYSRDRVIAGQFQTEHGFVLQDSFLGHTFPYGSVTIPTGIIWRGLLFNSVFFGVCLYALLSIASATRRLHRYSRGRCPHCAYDLRHDFSAGCSECGWRKEHASRNCEHEPQFPPNGATQSGSV
ncbi:MAG: hypothetical protein ACI89L_001041 [Phycisphaerales bacterium]|jgi:hypothetical protein